MRHRHRPFGRERGSGPLGLLLKYGLYALLLAGAGGLTWIALTPLAAPTAEVIRPLPADKLGHD